MDKHDKIDKNNTKEKMTKNAKKWQKLRVKMTKIGKKSWMKMTKIVTFNKKSWKLSTKSNNLLNSRTAERHARSQKHHQLLFNVLRLRQEYNAIKSLLARV